MAVTPPLGRDPRTRIARTITAWPRLAPLPFLLYRDDAGRRVLYELGPEREQLTIGRRASCDLALPWDD